MAVSGGRSSDPEEGGGWEGAVIGAELTAEG